MGLIVAAGSLQIKLQLPDKLPPPPHTSGAPPPPSAQRSHQSAPECHQDLPNVNVIGRDLA